VQAVDGQVIAYFEPLFADEPEQIGDVQPGWIDGVTVDTETLWATCFALMEQQTGLVFDRAWFDQKLPTYRIPDPDVLLKEVPDARKP
jgi:hypothetical protein